MNQAETTHLSNSQVAVLFDFPSWLVKDRSNIWICEDLTQDQKSSRKHHTSRIIKINKSSIVVLQTTVTISKQFPTYKNKEDYDVPENQLPIFIPKQSDAFFLRPLKRREKRFIPN